MPEETDDLEARRRRALYRAGHRGTREMDWLLGRFAAARAPAMDAAELEAFEAFLALPDPEIERWLLGHAAPPPDGAFAVLVARLRRFHKVDG